MSEYDKDGNLKAPTIDEWPGWAEYWAMDEPVYFNNRLDTVAVFYARVPSVRDGSWYTYGKCAIESRGNKYGLLDWNSSLTTRAEAIKDGGATNISGTQSQRGNMTVKNDGTINSDGDNHATKPEDAALADELLDGLSNIMAALGSAVIPELLSRDMHSEARRVVDVVAIIYNIKKCVMERINTD